MVAGLRDAVRAVPALATAALATAALATAAVACAHDAAPPGPTAGPVRYLVTNALVAPVRISVDGATAVILSSGGSSELTVAPTARSLTWTTSKPTDATGRPIPDDIGEVPIPLTGVGASIEISNVIDGQPHVTASVVNHTAAAASIGVSDGLAVSCAGALPAAVGGTRGFVQIGYYRLGPATEVRAYRDAARCSGPYVAWPRSQLVSFTPRAGYLVLSLDAAP